MLGRDIAEIVWTEMQDLEEPHIRATIPEVLRWINEGQRNLVEKWPTLLLNTTTGATLSTFTEISTIDSTLVVPDRWKTVLVEWVMYRAFSKEAGDVHHRARAAEHLKNYEGMVNG
jgi:hypothetical protein